MQDGKNLIIAIILCLMVVVGWSYLGEKMGWAPKQDPQKIEEAQKQQQALAAKRRLRLRPIPCPCLNLPKGRT